MLRGGYVGVVRCGEQDEKAGAGTGAGSCRVCSHPLRPTLPAVCKTEVKVTSPPAGGRSL